MHTIGSGGAAGIALIGHAYFCTAVHVAALRRIIAAHGLAFAVSFNTDLAFIHPTFLPTILSGEIGGLTAGLVFNRGPLELPSCAHVKETCYPN